MEPTAPPCYFTKNCPNIQDNSVDSNRSKEGISDQNLQGSITYNANIQLKCKHRNIQSNEYRNNASESTKKDHSCSQDIVLNDKSVKGLEFDIVFIADIDDFNVIRSIDEMKKRFYVMTSRAIKQLVLLRNSSNRKDYKGVDDILPNDENILKRMNRQ